MTTNQLRAVRFTWDDEKVFDGFTNDTHWNGFLNVGVTPAVHEEVKAYFKQLEGNDYIAEDWDIAPDENGLISYAYGFATSEVK